jgi:hypothetical protein
MDGFKYFLEQSEQINNIKYTLSKLPKSHAALVKSYKLKWTCGVTLHNDDQHVGLLDPNNKTITICSPWNYGKEYTFLHEIGHLVFSKFCSPKWKEKWAKIIKKNINRQKQNNEELWCMCYANHFVKNQIVAHTHPAWESYMKKFCKLTDNIVPPLGSSE